MREGLLGVEVQRLESPRDEAAYGSALLAMRGGVDKEDGRMLYDP